MVSIKLSDIDSSNRFINVQCVNPNSAYDPCATFQFIQNSIQTNKQNWIGYIQLNNQLSFTEQNIYRLIASAQDDAGNTVNETFIIKIVPSMKIAPKLDKSLQIHEIDEEKSVNTRICKFSLINEYEKAFGSFTLFNIVSDVLEVKSINEYGNGNLVLLKIS